MLKLPEGTWVSHRGGAAICFDGKRVIWRSGTSVGEEHLIVCLTDPVYAHGWSVVLPQPDIADEIAGTTLASISFRGSEAESLKRALADELRARIASGDILIRGGA